MPPSSVSSAPASDAQLVRTGESRTLGTTTTSTTALQHPRELDPELEQVRTRPPLHNRIGRDDAGETRLGPLAARRRAGPLGPLHRDHAQSPSLTPTDSSFVALPGAAASDFVLLVYARDPGRRAATAPGGAVVGPITTAAGDLFLMRGH